MDIFNTFGRLFKKYLPIIMIMVMLIGCGQANPMETAKSYTNAWAKLDFEEMYEALSQESRESISKDDFVERYGTIFSAIELNSLDLDLQEILIEGDDAYLPIDVVFNTETVESFQTHFTLPLILEDKQWKVVWTPSLIFPDMVEEDQVRLTSQHALRGDILDREDNPIAIEGEAYTVGGVPGKIPDRNEFAKALAPLLELTEEKILDELSKDWVRDDTLVPLRNFPLSISAEFKDKILSVKGVMLVTNLVTDSRRYLNNELYSHIVGYVQRVSGEDLEEKEGYRDRDLIGRQGIEASMEGHLHGKSGYSLFIRDADGNKKSTIAEIPARHGNTIRLTLDPDLQARARKALQGHVGSVTVLDGKSGEVLAMVSYPDYNPNIFPNGVLPSSWEALTEHPDKPFINRSTYALYPPGSTIKPFSAVMALEEGVINPNTVVEEAQKRSWTPKLEDWNAPPIVRTNHPEGPVNLDKALVWSDNIFFAWAALRSSYETMESYAGRLGIGQPLPFDVPVSRSILKRQDTAWSKHLLASSAIGQGEVLVTPLQMAAMYTAFINQGDMVLPKTIKDISTPEGEILEEFEREVWIPSAIPPKWVDTILPSLIGVVEDEGGTGRSLALDGLTIAAKTGTAQKDGPADEEKEEIAWLAAFTPDSPDPLVVVVALEVPAGEGRAKFDIVREIFMEYYGISPEVDEE